MGQKYTSAQTSINSKRAPAVYSMKKAVSIMAGKRVLDVGGGRFDTAKQAAKAYNSTVSIYDPYNRTAEHNAEVLAGDYDIAIVSNVLNVIDSKEARRDVLQLAAAKAGAVLVTVYEGDGSGRGKQTAADCWQENRRTADYVEEVSEDLPGWNVQRFGRLIVANNK